MAGAIQGFISRGVARQNRHGESRVRRADGRVIRPNNLCGGTRRPNARQVMPFYLG